MIQSLITIHCAINIHKHSLQQDLPHRPFPTQSLSREAGSLVAHACLLEGRFGIKVQCIKNKNKSKLKWATRDNWVNEVSIHIHSCRLTRFYCTLQGPVYFLVTLLSASPQESKLWAEDTTLQRSLAEGAACIAGTGTASRQSTEVLRTQIAGWFKKPAVHRAGHQRLRYFIAHWERFLPIPHVSAFAQTKLLMTHLLLFRGRATISFIHVLQMFESGEGLQISQEGCINSLQSFNCFDRPVS